MSEIKSKTGEYKGHPTVSVSKDGERIFSGGVKKSQAILDIIANPEAIEAIRKFVEDQVSEEDNK